MIWTPILTIGVVIAVFLMTVFDNLNISINSTFIRGICYYLNYIMIAVLLVASLTGCGMTAIFVNRLLTEKDKFPKARLLFALATLGFLLEACLMWFMAIEVFFEGFLMAIIVYLAMMSTVLFFTFLILFFINLDEVCDSSVSDIKIFVISQILICVIFSIIAIYDLMTATGFLAGIIGVLIFATFVPASVFNLISAGIYTLVLRRKQSKEIKKSN